MPNGAYGRLPGDSLTDSLTPLFDPFFNPFFNPFSGLKQLNKRKTYELDMETTSHWHVLCPARLL